MRKILIDEKYLFEVLTGRFGICEIGAILYAVQNCKDIELLNSESNRNAGRKPKLTDEEIRLLVTI